jgi:hypothetical protein
MIGTKSTAETADYTAMYSGRGAFHTGRRVRETEPGLYGSDYADMSNDKIGENPIRLNPKISWGRFVRPGLVGP